MATDELEQAMNKFHDELGPEKLRNLMDKFSGEKSTRELFEFLWNLEESHRCLSPTLVRSCKSDTEAERLRTEGNHFYKKKDFDKALELYNMSIMTAPHPMLSSVPSAGAEFGRRDVKNQNENAASERQSSLICGIVQEGDYNALALGYANRSAVLLEMELYDKCLEDINLALLHGYPESSQSKLEERKQKCCSAKTKNSKYKSSSLVGNCKSAQSILLSSCERPELPSIAELNPSMPSFSSSVKLAFSPDKGRHIIAEKDILPGEIIGIEKSYCSSLDMENMSTYCSNCLTHCLTPIPCPSCTKVVFCSEDCRAKALSEDHWLECAILPTLIAMEMKPVFTMVYKLMKYNNHVKWKNTLKEMQEQERQHPPERLGFNQDGVYSTVDYESVFHLVTNREQRPSGDLYVKCLIAFILTKLLQRCDRYFLDDDLGQPVTPTREDLLEAGETVFSNLMKISCNGFQLVEFQCTGPPITMNKKTIGSAVFPALSLVNHSCNPTAVPYISGNVQVLRASRFIPADEEITESYGKTFYFQAPEQRLMGLLEVYQFTCKCEACRDNWPTYHELPKTMQFRCIECPRPVSYEAPVCDSCKLDYRRTDNDASKQLLIDQWWAAVRQVKAAFEKSQCFPAKVKSGQPATEGDFEVIRHAVEQMDRNIPFPCQPLWEAYDALDLYFRLESAPAFAYLHNNEE